MYQNFTLLTNYNAPSTTHQKSGKLIYQFTLRQHVSAAICPSSGQYRTYKRYNKV